jgi:hypothetical protein
MAAPDLSTINEIYIDESSQTKHRHLLIGGIIVHAEESAALERCLAACRLPELPNGEAAWTKVSRAKLAAYGRMVDWFFDNPERLTPLEFHSLAVDTHRINDKAFNGGSRSIGFNKEIFQLCMKFGRLHKARLLHVYPDYRHTDQSPEELRLMLNRAIRRKGDKRDWPFRRVHFRDSASLQALQLVDVLLGAIAFRLNGHHERPDASPAKLELSAYVLRRARIRNPSYDTFVTGKFTLWHRNLR